MFQIEDLVVKQVIEIDKLTIDADVVSIEGQSGSGKSTLLRLLNNLDDPTQGDVFYGEKRLTDMEPIALRQKVVMVPQNPVVFDGTIRHNLLLGLDLSGEQAASDTQLNHMLKLFWLDKDLETNASDLSGGEKQRMALARVLLMKQAEVFLLDEPSSDLDDETSQHIMQAFIKEAKKQNQQIIMVTHDKHITEQFADQKINMDDYSMQIKREVSRDE